MFRLWAMPVKTFSLAAGIIANDGAQSALLPKVSNPSELKTRPQKMIHIGWWRPVFLAGDTVPWALCQIKQVKEVFVDHIFAQVILYAAYSSGLQDAWFPNRIACVSSVCYLTPFHEMFSGWNQVYQFSTAKAKSPWGQYLSGDGHFWKSKMVERVHWICTSTFLCQSVFWSLFQELQNAICDAMRISGWKLEPCMW